MTKKEAKQIIATWLVSSKGTKEQRGYIEGWFDEEDAEAFRMAIEALKAPTENTNTPTDTPTELISRDKAVNLVLNVCNDVMDECETVTGICGEEVYTDAREVDAILKCNKGIRNGIRRLPSEPVGISERLEWIPCSERLPEREGRYLVTNSAWGSWTVDVCAWIGHWHSDDKPIAWMELPKAWEGEKDETTI